MADVAWMLRQDAKSFPVKVHLYVMDDETLDSAAECAAFIIKTNSKDQDIAEQVLDAFFALRIEDSVRYDASSDDIDDAIAIAMTKLPYSFAYPISTITMLEIHNRCANYDDVDTLYEYCDQVRDNIDAYNSQMKTTINQQFSRVRYGGQTNSTGQFAGPRGSIWCRVSSTGFNWANPFYIFISRIWRSMKVTSVFICRDYESDYGDDLNHEEYFYKAKDGSPYYDMPIDEYLEEEHEHSPVFSSNRMNMNHGVLTTIRRMLVTGDTIHEVESAFSMSNFVYDINRFRSEEIRRCCIAASKFYDEAPTRTKMKLQKIISQIKRRYSFMTDIDIDCLPRENSHGNPVGFEMVFNITSEVPQVDGLQISIVSTYPLGQVHIETIVKNFVKEYKDYCEFKNIVF